MAARSNPGTSRSAPPNFPKAVRAYETRTVSTMVVEAPARLPARVSLLDSCDQDAWRREAGAMRLGQSARGGGENVEPDVVRELERAHRIVEAEADRRIDVLRRRDPLLGDPEALQDVRRQRPRRDETAGVAADDGLFSHPAGELLHRRDGLGRGLLRPDD